jgi:hypothetical protein
VIFDDHERNLQSDLGPAGADAQRHLRDDLRLLVMSATLDGGGSEGARRWLRAFEGRALTSPRTSAPAPAA